MSVSITSRPIVSGCNFNAAGNPILYKFQRFDGASMAQVNNNGGFVQVQINGVDDTLLYPIGDTVFLKTDNGVYSSSGTITASAFSGGNTLVTTTIPYTSSATTGFFLNLSIRTDYRLEIELFRSSDNSSLTNGVKFSYTHNSRGEINVDVSAIVKSFVSAEWSNPIAINEVDSEASLKFYIKYQQYFDGALIGSVTSDSGSPIHAVFAAMQIGSNNGQNMLAYYPDNSSKLWLTKFALSSSLQKLVMWRDWPFSLSFIYPNSLTDPQIAIISYDSSGSAVDALITDLVTSNNDAINRIKFSSAPSNVTKIVVQLGRPPAQPGGYVNPISIPDSSFVLGLAPTGPWTNQGTGDNWSTSGGNALFALSLNPSKILSQSLSISLRNRYIRVEISANISSGREVDIGIHLDGVSVGGISAVGTGAFVSYNAYFYSAGSGNSVFGISALLTLGGPGLITIQSFSVSEGFLIEELSDVEIEVRDVCNYNSENDMLHGRNPIHLFWKNSLGGDSFWNFGKWHEYEYTYQNGRKAKRIRLFEHNVHPVQWEALNELNAIGEVYDNNIIELTSSVNKTSTRVGQQVYMISKDGTKKIGVIVIPSSDSVRARSYRYSFAVEIELPEIFGME